MGRIEWLPIKDMPEEMKDGRRVLLAGGYFFCEALERRVTDPVSCQWWEGDWLIAGTEGGYVCVFYSGPTHFAEINAPT